jgi:hypothetical protein
VFLNRSELLLWLGFAITGIVGGLVTAACNISGLSGLVTTLVVLLTIVATFALYVYVLTKLGY